MIFAILSGIALFFLFRYLRSGSKKKIDDPFPLHKLEWKKDFVYLVQFPVAPEVRSISPFSIKLETWLRMTGIPYEPVYSAISGKKGQIPYIEFNGQHIPDSNLAIAYLKNYFKDKYPKVVEEDNVLTAEQLATGHITKVMLENHTCVAGFYWRYGLHMEEFYQKMVKPCGDAYSGVAVFFFRKVMPYVIKIRTHLQGLSRHNETEIAEFSFKDLDSISKILGNKKFYLGDIPSTIDCTIFGHIAQFLYIPMDFPQKAYLKKNCQNILEFMERMKSEFWPDWEENCQQACMINRMGRKFKK